MLFYIKTSLIKIKTLFLSILILTFLQSTSMAQYMECKVENGHWRDVAYLKKPMQKYAPYKDCIAWTAYQFDMPEELLYSILYVERGPVNGKCSVNYNGTRDCGPAQINDVRAKEVKRFNLTMQDIQKKPCHNIWAMGYLLRREIEKADGNIWRGVGNYHYHYSVNSSIHNRYVKKVQEAWNLLLKNTQDYCKDGK